MTDHTAIGIVDAVLDADGEVNHLPGLARQEDLGSEAREIVPQWAAGLGFSVSVVTNRTWEVVYHERGPLIPHSIRVLVGRDAPSDDEVGYALARNVPMGVAYNGAREVHVQGGRLGVHGSLRPGGADA